MQEARTQATYHPPTPPEDRAPCFRPQPAWHLDAQSAHAFAGRLSDEHTRMLVTASWGGEDMAAEVGAECRTLAALKALLQAALPELDVEQTVLAVGGRRLADDEAVCGLEDSAVVELSPTPRALATLRGEGHLVVRRRNRRRRGASLRVVPRCREAAEGASLFSLPATATALLCAISCSAGGGGAGNNNHIYERDVS